ncbi:MAG: hypothetical protein HY907_16090 [Deltaproteobacteria bacterium]|nr:hypothetical protein [Deltaproteobacteria bacterium]
MTSPDDAADGAPDGLGPLDDRPGPALPLAPARAAALVAAALDRAARPARAPSRRRLMLVAAAVVAFASVAAATGLYLVLSDSQPTAGPARRPEEETRTEAQPRGPTAPRSGPDMPSVGPQARPTTIGPEPRDDSPAGPVAPHPADGIEPAAGSGPAATTPPATEVPPAPLAPDDEAPTRRPPAAAEDLLLRANRLRGERRWGDAERTYAEVLRAAPGSDAAYAAAVAAAALRLERLDRPRDALELYERALGERPHGVLAEEAAFGIAESKRALGDASGEAEALRRFLTDWPMALMADRARERLDELELTIGP